MTTTTLTSAGEILDEVRRLAPDIVARAPEIESARRLPRDLLDQLATAGCFRTFLPASHGGAEADLASGLRVVEELSRADASVGWTVMIGAASWFNLAGLPRAAFDSLFADGPDVMGAGVFSPNGTARPVDGGYRIDGRWPFASGCDDADWLFANCVEEGDGEPLLRTVLLFPGDVTIEDTWHVSGLRGTGSHHVRVDDIFVPSEQTAPAFSVDPSLDVTILQIPLPPLFALLTASVALGAARGGLDDIVGLAGDKVPLMSAGTLAESPLFQHDLARMDTDLRAARALFYETADETWASAAARTALSPAQRARIRATAVWVTARTVAVGDAAYHAGGGTAVYAANPLQRRLRDLHAVTQHHLVKPDALTKAGAVLLGQDVDLTMF
jgi:alkylation response protein AidB-like acyl-CoA dehydrogenase